MSDAAGQLERLRTACGGRGWIGVELGQVSDDDLAYHVDVAWDLIAPKRLRQRH